MPNLDEFGREIPPPPRSARDAGGGGGSTRRHHHHHESSSPHHHHHHRSSHHQESPRRGPSKKSSLQHPSLLYVSEPLLCEYVWKDQKEGRAATGAGENKNESDTENKNSDDMDDTTDNNKNNETETYESYRRAYCLNYIRAFFNQHMDDSWFRQRYSAALRRRLLQQEQERAVAEAQAFAATVRSTEQVSLTSPDQWNAHLFRCCQGPQQESPQQTVVIVSKIPSNLTDEQVISAVHDGKKLLQEDVTLWPVHSKEPYLFRSVCILGPTAVLKDLSNKQSLTIECSSDPYNRMEYDADGHGGATADGLEVPLRKATVHIDTLSSQPKIVSLTKALSSKTRHTTDSVSAIQLAAQLDAQQKIPSEVRLASILERMSSSAEEPLSDVDRLDTAIAYLRRIHLRNFYHNVDHTANEQSFGDMIVHHNILYVRIKNAPDDEAPDDLLVQSLDQSIERALAASVTDSSQQQALQTEADTIAQAMQQTEHKWLDDHNISDNRGRARCSFHFCKKLFQDSTFLHKHLFKKHGEFLAAEQAKCHDASMMAAWDNIGDQPRPVPDVLVECGAKFGLVQVPLQPGAVPDIVDPEPGLFQEEEARQAMFAKRREEGRGERKPRPAGGGAGFIDVDDMKEEKIELSMDDVAAVVPVKKKKKKRKLL